MNCLTMNSYHIYNPEEFSKIKENTVRQVDVIRKFTLLVRILTFTAQKERNRKFEDEDLNRVKIE